MAQLKSVMIVAGEASADDHGAALLAALLRARPGIHCWGVGGRAMKELGFECVYDAQAISIAGLTEVLFAIPRIFMILRRLTHLVGSRRPDVVVLLDLPDFNLRLAKRLQHLQIPVVYYISPQVWAWRSGRVEQIRELVSQMLCILPFEQTFYQERGVRAQFVGHPLVEALPEHPDRKQARLSLGIGSEQQPVIALLPGSRPKEVSRHLSVMLEALKLTKRQFPDLLAVIPVASTIPRKSIEKYTRRAGIAVQVIDGQSTQALIACDAAVVCSGTSTLQTALLNRPMVVVYKTSWLTYRIVKRLVKVAYISLVNLIAEREVVPELVQSAMTPSAIDGELRAFLEDPVARIRLGQVFTSIRRKLGGAPTAERVAGIVLNYVPEARRLTTPVPGTMNTVRVVEQPTDSLSGDES